MPFVEIFVPAGTVHEDQRRLISSRVTDETILACGLPDNDAVRAMSWVVWHELDHWFVGGARTKEGEAPRYLVRVSVAEGVLTRETRADIVSRVVKSLADADPDCFHARPSSWVQFVEVPPDEQCLYRG